MITLGTPPGHRENSQAAPKKVKKDIKTYENLNYYSSEIYEIFIHTPYLCLDYSFMGSPQISMGHHGNLEKASVCSSRLPPAFPPRKPTSFVLHCVPNIEHWQITEMKNGLLFVNLGFFMCHTFWSKVCHVAIL